MTDKIIFLDLDGTIVIDKNYNCDVNKIELNSEIVYGLQKLSQLGYKLIIITNQSGIGRGKFSVNDFLLYKDYLIDTLKLYNIIIDGIYFCPHSPDDDCTCRKPKTGLIDQVKQGRQIDFDNSYFIGDKDSDILCGLAAGCKTVRICSRDNVDADSHYKVQNINQFAQILEENELLG